MSTFVDGKLELRFLRSLLCGEWDCAKRAVDRAPTGPRAHRPLPGTTAPPSSVDIDAFGFAISRAAFDDHFPDSFGISIGGGTVPRSSVDLSSTGEVRFVGTSNANLYVHVPTEEYSRLFQHLPPSAPSIHRLQASATARFTMPMPIFKSALASANISELVVTCYGLKDAIDVAFAPGTCTPSAIEIPSHLQWLRACISSSFGSRLDIGVVWDNNHDAPLFSRPGGSDKTGMRIFPIHVVLQATTKLMRYLRSTPADPLADRLPPGGWLSGGFHVPATFLRRAVPVHHATVSPVSNGDFYDRGVLLHPTNLAAGAGIGRSGVASVSLYNHHVKHAAVAVEPERGYTKMGWDLEQRAARSWVRELDALKSAAALERTMGTGQFGASAPAADDCGGDSWAPALKPPMDFLPAYCSFFPAAVLFILAGLKYPSAFLELVKLFSVGIGTSPAAFRSWAGHAFTLRCVAGGSV